MPENKDSMDSKDVDKGPSEQQLDDLDVNRQRERLERSRPGNLQSDGQRNGQQFGEGSPPKDSR